MIKANHTRFHSWFFKEYSRLMIKRHFRAMTIHNQPENNGIAIMVIGNHFSWWDGFFMLEINRRLWKKKFHVMMLEEQLQNNMFLNKVGAFSVKKGHRSVVESLQYAGELLENPENLVLMFPQGKIQSHHKCSFTFEKGVETILNKSASQPQVIFSAVLADYFSEKKPRLDVYLESVPIDGKTTTQELESKYNDFFHHKIEENDWER